MRRVLSALSLAVVLAGAGRCAAETFVLPAVVKGVPGMNGSFWESEVRILRMSLQQPFVVRRLWVATTDGGFVDDPATAPRWEFPPDLPSYDRPRAIILRGSDLLSAVGADSGAVAIETGGSALVLLRATNTAAAQQLPPAGAVTRGNGWLVRAATAPLQGPSTVPWSTTGLGLTPALSAYRTSLGLVNPNSQALDVRVRAVVLGLTRPPVGLPDPRLWRDGSASEPIILHLPPWGRVQRDDLFASLAFCSPIACDVWREEDPAVLVVEPLQNLPYFAYASQVFSLLNDPEMVMAVPGLPEGIPYQ
jgi:hypothetical protein